MSKKMERFGKYLLLDHLLDGGFARIFRARYLGDTASKICAIKVVLPQYSKDPNFKSMFMDEIKVTFGLLHPNIVQTYDYGTHNESLYVAMEYCDGHNLKEYLDKLKEKKFVFPVEICTYITTQICQGLHYAHTLTDKLTGQEIRIIHRDISPHNIMLTYDGSIKIIDFGIAKADTNSEATQVGTIKGKLSYIAPEYLEGKDLDGRYDQFAVGITLWEMLCGRKLFRAKNDIAILKLIQDCDIPNPSSINPNVPAELDEIVMKSLSRDRENRYENLDQMNRALIKFLYSKYPDFNATDLSYFAKELFKEEIAKDREKLFQFGKIDISEYIDDYKREASSGSSKTDEGLPEVKDSRPAGAKTRVLDLGFEDKEKVEEKRRATIKKSLREKMRQANEEVRARKKEEKQSPLKSGDKTKTTTIRNPNVTRTKVTVPSKGKRSSGLDSDQIRKVIAACILLVGLWFGYEKFGKNSDATVASNEEREEAKTRRPSSSQKTKSSITLKNFDEFSQKAFLDGKEVAVSVFGEISDIPLGSHLLRVEQAGKKHFIKRVSLRPDEEEPTFEIPDMEEAKFGYLVSSSDCVTGEISFEVFGEKRLEVVPIERADGIGFPMNNGRATKFQVYLRVQGEDLDRTIDFRVERENDLVDLCELI